VKESAGAQRGIRARTLLGPPLLALALGLGLGLLRLQGPRTAEQRLDEALSSTESVEAVQERVHRLRRESRALMPEDERQATRFLAWSATASGFRVEKLELRAVEVGAGEPGAGEPGAGVQAVEARLDLRGQVFDLPLALESLSMQAALLQLEALVIEVEKGGACTVALAGRYHRPVLPSSELSSQRAASLAPRSGPAAQELLTLAGTLSSWRGFAAGQELRSVLAAQRFDELSRSLPPALVAAARTGGRLTWAPNAGLSSAGLSSAGLSSTGR